MLHPLPPDLGPWHSEQTRGGLFWCMPPRFRRVFEDRNSLRQGLLNLTASK